MITVPGPAQPAAAGDPAAAAPAIHVADLRKRYGDVVALADVDLVVRAGEFFTLLGPSGSGKTTLLRLIAGFERPDGGRIELGGRDVTQVPPYARNVNTVFQDYALFPHMTVAQNIEYGLRVRHVPKAERREKVGQALEMVRLPGLGGRKPAQLSGGQRQRVALARAIVNEPEVLLLDEPLGALDLKLRQEMQLELQRVQRQVGITFVYVTHDQEEALTMSDRIAVLSHGRIEQIGGPAEVYERPRTRVRGRLHRRLQPDRARRPHDHRAAGEDHPARGGPAGPARHARGVRPDPGRHLRGRAHPLRRATWTAAANWWSAGRTPRYPRRATAGPGCASPGGPSRHSLSRPGRKTHEENQRADPPDDR